MQHEAATSKNTWGAVVVRKVIVFCCVLMRYQYARCTGTWYAEAEHEEEAPRILCHPTCMLWDGSSSLMYAHVLTSNPCG